MNRVVTGLAGALIAAILAGQSASAAEHEVQMLNKGAEGSMVFEPSLLKIAPGDTVRFVPADKGHNVLSIKGMTPADGAPFEGKMNQEITVTFDKPGLYGYECKPHYGMGMVGLIVVGDPVNLADARAVPQRGRAKQRFEALFGALPQ